VIASPLGRNGSLAVGSSGLRSCWRLLPDTDPSFDRPQRNDRLVKHQLVSHHRQFGFLKHLAVEPVELLLGHILRAQALITSNSTVMFCPAAVDPAWTILAR
jgi:hypothetical protein